VIRTGSLKLLEFEMKLSDEIRPMLLDQKLNMAEQKLMILPKKGVWFFHY
jgi:hypothetical protein